MYSLLKGYISKKPKEEEEDVGDEEDSKQEGSVVEFRSRGRQERGCSDPSTSYGGYLSWGWNTVSYLGGQLKKRVDKSLDWVNEPTAEIEAKEMAAKITVKSRRKKPDGTIEYTVGNNDTLPKIALKFDITPSELVRLNRLPSHMLFPGQVLYVPEQTKSQPVAAAVDSFDESVTPSPQLQNIQRDNSQKAKINGNFCEHGHKKIHLTKMVSLNDEDQEIFEHFLKIEAKYITDGQGVVNGVMLVTPRSVMFNPNVSDPLVLDRGRDVYCINTPMSGITSAAIYRDIAAMAIHDPLKTGRFHLDAATAESISRQNSVEMDVSLPGNPPSAQGSITLENIQESSPTTEKLPDLDIDKNQQRNGKHSSDHTVEPVSVAAMDRGLDSEVNRNLSRQTVELKRTIVEQSGEVDNEQIELMNIVNGLLNDLIAEVAGGECSHTASSELKGSPAMPVGNTSLDRDSICFSPVSEDSGISCPVNRKHHGRSHDLLEGTPRGLEESASIEGSPRHQNNRLSESSDRDMSQDSFMDGMSTVSSNDKQRSSSLLSSLSGEVKYWLGFGHKNAKDDEVITPRHASSNGDQPLYLCIRISKKHWCMCMMGEKGVVRKGEDLVNRDRRRREYWFGIPPSRVVQVYGFFKQWCPNIHETTSEEESDDEATLDTSTELGDEEGMEFMDAFYACTPPKPKVEYPVDTDNRRLEIDIPRQYKTQESVKTPDGFSDDVLFLPEMSTDSQILSEKFIKVLNKKLPSRTVGHSWVLVYSTFVHGFSLKTLYRNMECYDTPMLIVVQDDEHQLFGALSSCPLHISEGFYGTGESFLFKFTEDEDVKTYCWTGENNFFMKGSVDCLAFGSGGGHFGLWLDGDFYHGSSNRSETYNNDRLSKHEDFLCSALEIWTFE